MSIQNKSKKGISIALITMMLCLAIMVVPASVLGTTNQKTDTDNSKPITSLSVLSTITSALKSAYNTISNAFSALTKDSLSGSFR
jgi:hypothetical protein